MARRRKPPRLNEGERIALLCPNCTDDGRQGTIIGMFVVGPAVLHYNVQMDNGEILYPLPTGIRSLKGGL